MPLAKRRKYPIWIGIALSFYAFIAIGATEGGLGVLIPSIQATFHLSPASVTPLFLSQLIGYIAAALYSSFLSSRMGLARMLLLASSVLTIALCLYAKSPSWAVMVATGIVAGLGIGLIDAGVNTYIADDQRNAHLMGTLHAFYGIGSLLGPIIASNVLANGLSWRSVYLVLASLMGLTVAFLLWIVLSDYKPMMQKMAASDTAANTSSLQLAFSMPTVLVTGVLLLVYVGMETSFSDWSYSVQALTRDTPELLAGYSVSAYWLGLTLGRFGMGQMVERFGAVCTLNYALTLLTFGVVTWWLVPEPLLSLPLIGLALGPIFPIAVWLMPQRVSAASVPTAIGFITSAGSVGAATIPTTVGWIADRAGLEIIPLLMVLQAILLVGLHRWLVRYAPTQTYKK